MGQRVIATNSHAFGCAALNRKENTVIGLVAFGLVLADKRQRRSTDIRIGQRQFAPGVGIARGRTRSCGRESILPGLTVAGNIDSGIQLLSAPHVDGMAAHVAGGYEPVCRKLLLDAQIPCISSRLRSVKVQDEIIREGRELRIRIKGFWRKWIAARKTSPWIVETTHRTWHGDTPGPGW